MFNFLHCLVDSFEELSFKCCTQITVCCTFILFIQVTRRKIIFFCHFPGIPLLSVSQPNSGIQTTGTVSVASVLKPSDKISASFAQLVQTSTGKHILLTSNPNIPGNITGSCSPTGKLFVLRFLLFFSFFLYY